VALIVRRSNKYLVRQRPEGGINGGLWEFPNFEINSPSIAESIHPYKLLRTEPRVQFHHSITRHRIQLQAFEAELTGPGEGTWKTTVQLRRLPFTGAHKNILDRLK
jgi:adenine-specific DNA glycosylase